MFTFDSVCWSPVQGFLSRASFKERSEGLWPLMSDHLQLHMWVNSFCAEQFSVRLFGPVVLFSGQEYLLLSGVCEAGGPQVVTYIVYCL